MEDDLSKSIGLMAPGLGLSLAGSFTTAYTIIKEEHDRIERTSLILAQTALSLSLVADILMFIINHDDAMIEMILFREVIINLWIIAIVIGIVSISIMPRPDKDDRWWKKATWYLMPFVIVIHGVYTMFWCRLFYLQLKVVDQSDNPES